MSMLKGIISITVGAIMLSQVFMSTIKGTNTSTWSTSEVALWGLLGLIGIVGLVYGVGSIFGIV